MDEPVGDLSVRDLVGRLATSDPVPGGGSASAIAGAMAAALVGMVTELSFGRPAAVGNHDDLAEIRTAAAERRLELMELSQLDALAYDAVVRARRLPRVTDAERAGRQAQVDEAVLEATRVPLATARAASAVLDLAGRLAPIGNRNAVSDVGVAALLADAALRGAALNVEINLPSLRDEVQRHRAADAIAALLADLDRRTAAVRSVVARAMR